MTNVADSSNTPLATYTYLGAGHVVKTYLEEPDAYSSVVNSGGTVYDGLDRFNRPIKSRWTKDLSTDVDFFSVNVGWDRASNVQHQDDQVQVGHDTLYANDARNRLTDADEGTITIGTPSTIGSGTRTRRQTWVLTQTGNWSENLVDFNNDGDGLDTGELEETRAHNKANELVSRDTNSSSPAEFNLVHDEVGNMTSDNENYQYKWDAFGRLREVKNLSNNVVSEYWYNGLGYLTARLQDTNLDGVANSTDDRKYVTIYDERWRQVATYRVNPSTGALDANPKEQFLYHAAGNGGWGGSSYIDSVISRHSVSNSWTAVGASTLSNTLYYCQNWRADVVALLDEGGVIVHGLRYSAYGVPFGIPYGDVDADGVCNGVDAEIVTEWITDPIYDVRGDLDLDGDVDTADYDEVVANDGDQLGYGALSTLRLRNRKGYAGYEGDSSLSAVWHVRNRILRSSTGAWASRDPAKYLDGPSLVEYVTSAPMDLVDPNGTFASSATGVCRKVSASLYGQKSITSNQDHFKRTDPKNERFKVEPSDPSQQCPELTCYRQAMDSQNIFDWIKKKPLVHGGPPALWNIDCPPGEKCEGAVLKVVWTGTIPIDTKFTCECSKSGRMGGQNSAKKSVEYTIKGQIAVTVSSGEGTCVIIDDAKPKKCYRSNLPSANLGAGAHVFDN